MGRILAAGGWGTSGAEGLRCWTLSDDFTAMTSGINDLGIYNLVAIENGLYNSIYNIASIIKHSICYDIFHMAMSAMLTEIIFWRHRETLRIHQFS